jgi:D-alanyl-lipoteichoic acid acyltransferase DltB (MBOAT superfamily)
MLFNSYIFIFLFLPVTLIGYFALLKKELIFPAKVWLFFSSLFFYGFWNFNYLFLILASILINYSISNVLQTNKIPKLKKSLFAFSLVFNIGLLCFFKYMDFFIQNINYVTSSQIDLLHIILPLGISFFTLQQLAFIIDVYTGLAKENKFIDYALFVSFFPQLIAGPIVHYKEVIPQFQDKNNKKFSADDFSRGIYIFVIGLFKKVMIADSISSYVSTTFDHDPSLHFFAAWGASLAYSFQIYFDFSGYTDMAIGLGRMFNIKIPTNFKSPYKTTNIVDFWSRWHITLTNFITAYVFTPLVRSMPRMTFGYMMFSMFLAMTIAGLWHGAAWTFVIFGVLHGGAIVIHHNWKKKKIKLPTWLAWFITFNFVNICFTMFRATNIDSALKVYKGMIGMSGFVMPKGILSTKLLKSWGIEYGTYMTNDENLTLALIIIGFIIVTKFKNSTELLDEFKESQSKAFWTACMFIFCIFGLNRLTEFIYFNF